MKYGKFIIAIAAVILGLIYSAGRSYRIEILECNKEAGICTHYRQNYFGKKLRFETFLTDNIESIDNKLSEWEEKGFNPKHKTAHYCTIYVNSANGEKTSIYNKKGINSKECEEKAAKIKEILLEKQYKNTTININKL